MSKAARGAHLRPSGVPCGVGWRGDSPAARRPVATRSSSSSSSVARRSRGARGAAGSAAWAMELGGCGSPERVSCGWCGLVGCVSPGEGIRSFMPDGWGGEHRSWVLGNSWSFWCFPISGRKTQAPPYCVTGSDPGPGSRLSSPNPQEG